MNKQEKRQMATEMWELARKSHWLPVTAFSYVSDLGYFRKPDTMEFPATEEGLQEAYAWLKQQALITWIKRGEKGTEK